VIGVAVLPWGSICWGHGWPSLRVSARSRTCPMTTTTPSAALVSTAPVFTNTERLALAGFLAGYSGLTREAYELDLRQFANWCHQHHLLRLLQARRADIGCFARDPEARGRARATAHAGPAPSRGSTTTPSRKNSSAIPRPAMSAGPAWTTSPRHRPGPLRTRRAAGRRRTWAARRAGADLPAGPERAARTTGRSGHMAVYSAVKGSRSLWCRPNTSRAAGA
jgi:hypothetical protein